MEDQRYITRKLDWDKLLAFYHVAKAGKLALASKQLKIAQPALSRTIRILEEQVGVKLFFRSVQGLTPSPEGATLLETVSRMYEDIQTTVKIIRHEEEQAPRRDYTPYLGEWKHIVHLDVKNEREKRGIASAQALLEAATSETVAYIESSKKSFMSEINL